jgi:hypothetical protein
MSQSFRAINAACDLLGFPGASLDDYKARSDREGEEERPPLRACGPCERGEHNACWSEPPNKPYWYCCLCRGRKHRG